MSTNNSILVSPSSSIIFLNELGSIQNWQRELILGSGSFAIITLWVNTASNERIALKQYRNNYVGYNQKQISYYNEQWKQEIKIMKQLKCENVVKALELPKEFLSLKISTPVLAMEFCSGGDLRKVLNKPQNCCGVEEKEVRQILKQVSSAIEYLHSLNIIHRDLKPENIVLQPLASGKILYKLTDLGYAKQLSESTFANSFVGTLEYLAPELFLRVEYSSAVDNWSFGLLAYEIITGRRPFLPHHSMADILDALKKKKSTDICTEVDELGNFYFSSEISPINNICTTLKTDLESWLKIVLEYDPNKRGGQRAFRLISNIMNKYIIQLFSMNTYEVFSYEINRKTTLDDLREQIFSNTNINPTNQYLILPNGELPKTLIGQQLIESWYSPETWFERYNPIVVFVFDYSKQLNYQEIYKSLTLPPMVENMLLDPSRSMDYDELKLTWRSSVWVAQQTVKKYSLLHEALKSTILNCINFYNHLQTRNNKLATLLSTLFSSVNSLARHLKYQCENSAEKCDPELLSDILNHLNQVCTFRKETVQPMLEKTKQIIPKFDKENLLFESFFKSSEIEPSLMKKYIDIQSAYETLRKRKKDDKQSSNNHMINLLCDCFKLVEGLMEKIFLILSMLVAFIKNIDQLYQQNNHLQEVSQEWQLRIDQLQQTFWKSLSQSTPSSTPQMRQLTSQLNHLNLDPKYSKEITKLLSDLENEDSLYHKASELNQLEFCNFLF